MKLTRRHVVAMLAALPVAGGAGLGALAWRWWDRPAGDGLRALSDEEYAFAQALAEAWMPPGGDPPLSGAEADLGGFLDEMVAGLDPDSRRLIKALLRVLDDGCVPLRGARYVSLDLPARTEQLRDWLASDIPLLRTAVTSLVVLLAEGFTLHPQVSRRLVSSFGCGFGR